MEIGIITLDLMWQTWLWWSWDPFHLPLSSPEKTNIEIKDKECKKCKGTILTGYMMEGTTYWKKKKNNGNYKLTMPNLEKHHRCKPAIGNAKQKESSLQLGISVRYTDFVHFHTQRGMVYHSTNGKERPKDIWTQTSLSYLHLKNFHINPHKEKDNTKKPNLLGNESKTN